MKKSYVVSFIVLVILVALALLVYKLLPVSLLQEPRGSEVAKVDAEDVTIETVAENLAVPWSIDFSENGDIFFTERPGLVRIIQNDELSEEPILKLPQAESEGGTLGLALSPDFNTTKYVYVYYTTEDVTNRISRFRFNGTKLVEEKILVNNIPGSEIHNGGQLAFGPDGKLYAGTGDAKEADLAQNKKSLAGKILRLEADGDIPVNNPDPESYVYSMGHRNVQGLDWNEDGDLYATEHGSDDNDEVNKIEAGANYGWPVVEGHVETGPAADTPVANYRNPVKNSGDVTWAPSGATFYTGNKLPEVWHDKFLFAGLRSRAIWRLNVDTGDLKNLFDKEYGRLRDIQQGPDGHLYILTSNQDGRGSAEENDDRILRIAPKEQ